MNHDDNPPCWRDAKAWAEEQEAGDAVAAILVCFFALSGVAALLLY